MIITNVTALATATPAPARPGVGGFSVPVAPELPRASGTAAAGRASSLDAMLALQEAQSEPAHPAAVRDRDARRRGQGLLAALAALQHALLAEADPVDALRQLAALLDGPAAADPQLEGAVRALSLRAAIELARRGL